MNSQEFWSQARDMHLAEMKNEWKEAKTRDEQIHLRLLPGYLHENMAMKNQTMTIKREPSKANLRK